MAAHGFVALALLKFAVAFLVFFVYLPGKLFPRVRGEPPIERFVWGLVLMTASGIVVVHLLSLLQVYSIVSVLVGYALLALGIVRARTGAFPFRLLRRLRVQNVVFVLDVLDRVVDPQARLRERLRRRLHGWWSRLGADGSAVVHASLFGLILAYAAALRALDVFRYSSFPYSDPYTHLLWLKELESGNPYPPGIQAYYPKGFHAVAAILHGLTRLDEGMTLRLMGPLSGVLLVVAAYAVGRRLTGNREAALVGMFVFGTFIEAIPRLDRYLDAEGLRAPWGTISHWFTRQTAPLPEEFALVFLPLALMAAHDYIVERRRASLMLFALAVLTVFMVHPLVAAVLGVGLAGLGVLALALGLFTWRSLLTLSGTAVATALLGNLQLIYGALFSQTVLEKATDYTTNWLAAAEEAGPQPFTLENLASAGLGLLFLGGGLLMARGRARKVWWAFSGLFLLTLVFLNRSVNFGVSYLLPPDRVGHYRVLFLCGALAGVFHVLSLHPLLARWYGRHRWLYQGLTVGALVALGVAGLPAQVPSAQRYEYDALARFTEQIKRSYPPLEWTIVSTVEDYSKAFKRGWHMNVGEFLARYDPHAETFDMPTPHTFLFVEKRPFGFSTERTLQVASTRLDLERRLQEWVTIYNLTHDDAAIHYEDWDIIVYRISKHRPPPPRVVAGGPGRGALTRMIEGLRGLVRRSGS